MLVGFVDGRGRAYDIGFRTLRFSLLDDEGLFLTGPSESVAVQAPAVASMDLVEPRSIPLLAPTHGELLGTDRRVVFLAAKGLPRKQPYTFYNISLSLHSTAVQHFFTAQGGREFVLFETPDLTAARPKGNAVEIDLRGPVPATGAGVGTYRLRIEPRSVVDEALQALT